eukprot:TRINITY_DN10410_c0_g1_i10.p1 TRINITY_DN10410_c0_g1~~TRINITY_DN10410_c0_g1_i10.p1  ORF type:complete len:637 (-),score=70.73 TRINITY_DN10410_c0_g1_i10:241-2151(-)
MSSISRRSDAEEDDSILDCYAEIKFFPQNVRLQKFMQVPLRFKDHSLETSFLTEYHLSLRNMVEKVGLLGLIFTQILTVIYVAIYANVRDFGGTRRSLHFAAMWTFSTLLGLCRKQIGRMGEPAVLVLYVVFFTLAFAFSEYRQAVWWGEPLDIPLPSDSFSVLLACMMSVAAFMLDIRSRYCLAMVAAAPVIYLACTVSLPYDPRIQHNFEGLLDRKFTMAMSLGGLNVLLFAGRCNVETLRRVEFLRLYQLRRHLVQEKVMRVQAEHQAEEVSAKRAPTQEELSSLTSNKCTESILSSAVFDPASGCVDLQLQAIAALAKREQWLIRPWQITCSFEETLGSGAQGQVFKGMYLNSPAAIKFTRQRKYEESLGAIATELRILRNIRHINIVSFYGACLLPQAREILLVEELVQGSTLSQTVMQSMADEQQCHHVLVGLCAGLAYLHSHHPPIVHADLKPDSIIVERPLYTTRIIDFGLSKYQRHRPTPRAGTLRWQAPETLKTHKATTGCDMYSTGLIAFYAIARRKPHEDVPREALKELLLTCLSEGVVRPLAWPEPPVVFQENCQAFCAKCLVFEPTERASAADLLKDIIGWPHPLSADDQYAEEALMASMASSKKFLKPTDFPDQGKQTLAL